MTDAEKAEMRAKEAEVEALKLEVAKAQERVDNAQGLIQRWEGEVGKTREEQIESAKLMKKLVEDLAASNEALKKVEKDFEQVRGELAVLKAKGPSGDGEGHSGKQPEDMTADELEATLTEAEASALDEAFKTATQEQKLKIKSDPEFRKRTMLQAREAVRLARQTDLSSWRNTPEPQRSQSSAGDPDEIAKLFKTTAKGANFVPPGPGTTASRPGAAMRARPGGNNADWFGQ